MDIAAPLQWPQEYNKIQLSSGSPSALAKATLDLVGDDL
jgi:hypothetical protein